MDFATLTKSKKTNRDLNRDAAAEEEEESDEEEEYDEDNSSDLELEDDVEEKGTLMIVVKDSKSKAIRAHALKNKSVKHTYGTRKVCADLEEWGYGKVILRSDGEPAIRALKKKVKLRREGDTTLLEITPRADPKANGEAEAAVREISCKGDQGRLQIY